MNVVVFSGTTEGRSFSRALAALGAPYPPASHSYTMLICLNDLFACLGLAQTRKLLTNFSKNSFYLLLEPLRLGEFLTNY